MPLIWAGFVAAVLLLAKGVTTLVLIGRRLSTMLLPPLPAEFARFTGMIWKRSRRAVVALVGGTVLLLGIVMVALPGPATVVVPLGLAILATEFVWARRLLTRIKEKLRMFSPKSGDDSASQSKSEAPQADPPSSGDQPASKELDRVP